MKTTPIDVAEMQRLFYIKDDFLYYKIDRGTRARVDKLAGTFFSGGANSKLHYIRVRIGDQRFLAHRIIWAMRNGRDPGNLMVDHKKDIFVDFKGKQVLSNAKSNLRLADDSQSNHNRLRKGKPPKGCSWSKKSQKWMTQIKHKGQSIWLGYFDTEEEAHAAYIKAKNEIAGRFTPSEIRDTGLEMT